MSNRTGRVLCAVALSLGMAGAATAQQLGTIIGQVNISGTDRPLRGAQVVIVGTSIGGLSNAEGRFTLTNVPLGALTVRVQSLGFGTLDQRVTVAAGAPVTVRFDLKEEALAVEGLVVTAMGIQKSERSLGYAVQSVTAAALARSPEVTLVNALAGQSAGVQVLSSGGRPGAGARITIRGESSFLGGGQPLFVVDGVPISIDTDSKMTAVNVASPHELDFGEAGSRAMDIDPNNIEEISILRGAAATALYGSRAAAGAVIIKTKQGTPGMPARFSVSSRVGFDRPILGGYVTDWAAGDQGYFCNGRVTGQGGWCQPGFPAAAPNPATGLNWGPHKDSIPKIVFDSLGSVRFRDARDDFYETGLTVDNSVGVNGSMAGGNYSLGISNLSQAGITPASKLN
ncbi:MAG: TonB-dependent receptor plug domain-containing protein, partial [Longimicrobiales bacterium]